MGENLLGYSAFVYLDRKSLTREKANKIAANTWYVSPYIHTKSVPFSFESESTIEKS